MQEEECAAAQRAEDHKKELLAHQDKVQSLTTDLHAWKKHSETLKNQMQEKERAAAERAAILEESSLHYRRDVDSLSAELDKTEKELKESQKQLEESNKDSALRAATFQELQDAQKKLTQQLISQQEAHTKQLTAAQNATRQHQKNAEFVSEELRRVKVELAAFQESQLRMRKNNGGATPNAREACFQEATTFFELQKAKAELAQLKETQRTAQSAAQEREQLRHECETLKQRLSELESRLVAQPVHTDPTQLSLEDQSHTLAEPTQEDALLEAETHTRRRRQRRRGRGHAGRAQTPTLGGEIIEIVTAARA